MKRIIVSVAVAVALGVTVMFLPILTYTHLPLATDNKWLTGGENMTFGEDQRSETAASAPDATKGYTSIGTLDDAAQTLGKLDTGPSPFPSSLFYAILVAATGLAAALGVSLYSKKKMRLVQSLNL